VGVGDILKFEIQREAEAAVHFVVFRRKWGAGLLVGAPSAAQVATKNRVERHPVNLSGPYSA
jgi:hypothetical protein